MIWLHWMLTGAFAVLGAGCLILVIAQLPGTWLMLVLGLGVQLVDVMWIHDTGTAPGWWGLGVGAALAVIGEVLEGLAGVAGAKAGGGSGRALWVASIGGVLGAIVLTPVIPIPVLGTFVGAIVGAFAGAFIGETSGRQPATVGQAITPAAGAAAGRAVGTIFKVAIAVAVWLVVLAGLLIR